MVAPGPPPLPVTILTGFLGSGKTTLLNRILRDPDCGQVAVIVNELGEVGLDNLLVESIGEDTVLLSSGCICCAVRNDLVETLVDLHRRRDSAAIPAFQRVVIETTGLAEPAPIMQTLMSDPELLPRYYLDGIVTTVDAVDGVSELAEYGESAKQVAVADRLVVTKVDLASDEAVTALEALVRRLNPGAALVRAVNGAVDMAGLLNVGLYDAATRRPDVPRWLRDEAYARPQSDPAVATGHTPGVHAFCLYREGPLSRALLGMWLAELSRGFGASLLRVKGIVHVAGAPGPMVIQGVQHRFYAPVTLGQWPSDDRRTRIVFIVRGLEQDVLERSLDAAIARWPVWPSEASAG